jgi:hypothetical protein
MSEGEALRIEVDEEAYELLTQLPLASAIKLLSRAVDLARGGTCKIAADDVRRIAADESASEAANDFAATTSGHDGPAAVDQPFSANRVLLVLGMSILIGSAVALGALLIRSAVHNDTLRILITFVMLGMAAVLIGAIGLIVARYTANHTQDPQGRRLDSASQPPATSPGPVASPSPPTAGLPGESTRIERSPMVVPPGNPPPARTNLETPAARWWTWVLSVTGLLAGIGILAGYLLVSAAQQNQTCVHGAQSNSWNGIQISGLPSAMQSSFGYGRGTQVIESTLNAVASAGVTLPTSIAVFAEPLTTSDGTQTIPSASLSNTRDQQASRGVSAVAIRIPSSSVYQLQVCVKALTAAAGSYSGQLLFPGAKLASGTSLPVTVTFQSQIVPYALSVAGLPLGLLGMLYSTLILIRRKYPDINLHQIPTELQYALWSINGAIALILSVGAIFTTWNVQCYRNPTWGTPWPTILVTLVTMAGAAAGASTVPMGLSKE